MKPQSPFKYTNTNQFSIKNRSYSNPKVIIGGQGNYHPIHNNSINNNNNKMNRIQNFYVPYQPTLRSNNNHHYTNQTYKLQKGQNRLIKKQPSYVINNNINSNSSLPINSQNTLQGLNNNTNNSINSKINTKTINPFLALLPTSSKVQNSSISKIPSQNHFNQNKKSKIKNTLMLSQLQQFNKQKSNQIQMDIIIQAMNHSFTRRISNGKDIQMVDMIMDFALSQQQEQQKGQYNQSVLHAKWFTVQLDEGKLPQKSFFDQMLCNRQKNLPQIDGPKNLKFYHLVLPFQGKQINLVSMQNSNNYFIINLDLIQVKILDTSADPLRNQVLRLRIDNSWNIDLYITSKTQPFVIDQTINFKVKQLANNRRNQLQIYLRKSIQNSRAVQLSLKNCVSHLYSDYQKYRFVSEQQFVKYCQTGDLLLFKDNHTMAKIQRAITSSQYDHVAVVFRSQKYGICLFESNSSTGVAIAVWNHLIRHRWFQNIQKIAWKKLEYDRPADFQQKVDQFIKANLHKQFSIDLPKLLRFKSVIYKSVQQQKNRTYFCSQLIATLYKHLGLLQPGKSSTQYWPKDFTDNGHILMLKNSSLGKQRHIIFNQQILKKNYPFLK